MTEKFDLNSLRVASPCSVSWESMTGDEKSRACQLCHLSVYNISSLTTTEAEKLILNREGCLCIRLYRRTDGTVLTKDCPVGLRAVQKRAARFAGAAFATILGLFSISFGQKEKKDSTPATKVRISRTTNHTQAAQLTGTVLDPNGAVIPGAMIMLYRKDGKDPIQTSQADSDGAFSFGLSDAGVYRIVVKASGFRAHSIFDIEVRKGEKLSIDATLRIDGESVTIGILAEEPYIDMSQTSLQTTVFRRPIN